MCLEFSFIFMGIYILCSKKIAGSLRSAFDYQFLNFMLEIFVESSYVFCNFLMVSSVFRLHKMPMGVGQRLDNIEEKRDSRKKLSSIWRSGRLVFRIFEIDVNPLSVFRIRSRNILTKLFSH